MDPPARSTRSIGAGRQIEDRRRSTEDDNGGLAPVDASGAGWFVPAWRLFQDCTWKGPHRARRHPQEGDRYDAVIYDGIDPGTGRNVADGLSTPGLPWFGGVVTAQNPGWLIANDEAALYLSCS